MLHGNDTPGRETSAVTDPINQVHGGSVRITRTQKVCVQRVHKLVGFNRAPGCHQCLGCHLTPEGAKAVLVSVRAPKDVFFDRFKIEQADELFKSGRHGPILAGVFKDRSSPVDNNTMGPLSDAEPSFTLKPAGFIRYARSPEGMKWVRFGSVSAVAIVVNFVVFATVHYTTHAELMAKTVAAVLSTMPAYYLSRRWVWSIDGKSDLRKEVIPFWIVSLVQFAVSLMIIGIAARFIKPRVASHSTQTLLLLAVDMVTYGAMWVGKFVLLNRVLFRVDPAVPAAATA
jgi:putative flippase GtrA